MTMHTKSYNDKDARERLKRFFERRGYVVFDPPYNTSKVGDLVVIDAETKDWFIAEVEQMGERAKNYVDSMKGMAKGNTPRGKMKDGLSIVPRKFEYTDYDREVSDILREDLKEAGLKVPDGQLEWDIFYRIAPDQKGMFVAKREDVSGSITGTVNTENGSFEEERRVVPWRKVDYVPLD